MSFNRARRIQRGLHIRHVARARGSSTSSHLKECSLKLTHLCGHETQSGRQKERKGRRAGKPKAAYSWNNQNKYWIQKARKTETVWRWKLNHLATRQALKAYICKYIYCIYMCICVYVFLDSHHIKPKPKSKPKANHRSTTPPLTHTSNCIWKSWNIHSVQS